MTHSVPRPHRFVVLGLCCLLGAALHAADERLLPASLPKDQRAHLLEFLKTQESPKRYVPQSAKLLDASPPAADLEIKGTPAKPIRQYTVQITPHRPVPGAETVTRADVYYYRPNPEKGKQGITIKHTVDLTTGKQIGQTEVFTRAHTPVSREELAEAVAAVKERSDAVKKLYEGRQPSDVRYEYLQMKINRKNAEFEPGDRVVRFVFTANPAENERPPEPVRVLVNLTKDLIVLDKR